MVGVIRADPPGKVFDEVGSSDAQHQRFDHRLGRPVFNAGLPDRSLPANRPRIAYACGRACAQCAVGETCVVDSARKEVSVDAEISWVPGWSEGRGPLADQGHGGFGLARPANTPAIFWHILVACDLSVCIL